MGHITIKKTINAPVEAVFGYVDNYKNTTKYMKGLTRWEPAGDIVHGKDAEFDVVMKAGPANLGSIVHITGWTENKTIAWKSIEGFKQTGKWAFTKKGDTTEATFDMDYELGGGIAGKLLAKAADPVVRMNLESSVTALKEQTEKLAKKTPAKSPAKPAAKTGPASRKS